MEFNQSLQSQLHQLLPHGENEPNIIKTPLLRVVKNTIVFRSSVYQISNICSIELTDLSQIRPVDTTIPAWYLALLVSGLVLIGFYYFEYITLSFGILGISMLVLALYLFWQHSKLERFRKEEKYGLQIGMNSAEKVVFTSRSKEFVLKTILVLYVIMNSEEPRSVTFNFETNTFVEDRSVNIGQAYGAAVVSGEVLGDVVNNV